MSKEYFMKTRSFIPAIQMIPKCIIFILVIKLLIFFQNLILLY